MRDFCNQVDVRVAPSRWLAAQAEQQGLESVAVIPHGVDGGLPRKGADPLSLSEPSPITRVLTWS